MYTQSVLFNSDSTGRLLLTDYTVMCSHSLYRPLGVFLCVCVCVCVKLCTFLYFIFYTSPSYFLVLIFLPKHSLLQMDKALLNSFIFCCLVAGGLIVLSAISVVSLFKRTIMQMTQPALGKKNNNKTEKQQLYALLQHVDAVRSWMKAEWEKSYSTADLSRQKWNSTLSCSQHSYFGTCPFDVHWKLVKWKFSLLPCDTPTQQLVRQW